MDDGIFGYLVKNHPLHLDRRFLVKPQSCQQMPGDRLPFTVGVGCQQQAVSTFKGFPDGINMFFAFRQNLVLGLKIIGDINRALLAGQCPYMAKRGHDRIAGTEEAFNGLGLGRRFYYDKIMRHVVINPYGME